MLIHFILNDTPVEADIQDGTLLLDLLREGFGMSSVRRGCENAECGACTVLLDGTAINSCIFLAVRADGRHVTTLEGVGSPEKLTEIQKAFVEHGALQCGFCGSGMILSAMSLLNRNPSPSREDIREGIAGNLCRCSGYVKIESAIEDAAQKLREKNEC